MISRLSHKITNKLYSRFADALYHAGFTGDIELGFADRMVLATDNSVYQVLPEGVLFPKSTQDISTMMRLSATTDYNLIVISPRGGGTGTNGQSLTNGFMVDTSRYMNKILEINLEERWARVQAGVVKDNLNELVGHDNLFFAPELSTSNRATIGGMVNTDASGQGSVIYGKTRNHVLELTSVLSDGSIWNSSPINDNELQSICDRHDLVANIHNTLSQIYETNKETIATVFPKINRSLTGYDLAHIRRNDGLFDLNAILCGSEGTLAIISEIKINLLPVPEKTALILVFYNSFNESLQDALGLMAAMPDSIETIDSKVFALAKADRHIWHSVHGFFPGNMESVDGINFVEYSGENESQLNEAISRLINQLEKPASMVRVGYKVIRGKSAVDKIWNMRKQAVGLLGSMEGDARPIPFVEDVAVPPRHLSVFIEKFRALLDQHQLRYGMFGHVDAGVLHVRPAIDMKDPIQAKLVRSISDQIANLARDYGGVLWGEHGKGFRSEYAPDFFADLYPALQRIKSVFDPHNQLNPGKIATPITQQDSPLQLLKIDEVPTRGESDREIERRAFDAFSSGMYCNGNGACFNYNPKSAMCPTWKATYNRIQSPKGRSGLVREWLRLQSLTGFNIEVERQRLRRPATCLVAIKSFIAKTKNTFSRWKGEEDFSHDVYQSLDSCMGCKSCTGQCPVRVSVPELRSQFFELYHGRYPRPIKHHLMAMLEPLLPVLAKVKWAYNGVLKNRVLNVITAKLTGLTDLPVITSSSPMQECIRAGAKLADMDLVQALSGVERKKTVIIVQDAFTSFFETALLVDLVKLLVYLGYQPLIAQFRPNGKILHLYGFLQRFDKVARINAAELSCFAKSGVELVGIDAAVTLTYRDEYRQVLGSLAPDVQLLSEWFNSQLDVIRQLGLQLKGRYILLSHCTEVTSSPESVKQWHDLYEAVGLQLDYEPTGCCGMSGIYGHETHNQTIAQKLYDLSWREVVEKQENNGRIVVTGYSCRSQIKRYVDCSVDHPIQALSKVMGL